jgi:hypothetical protein
MERHLIIFRLWLCYTAGMVCFGWILSLVGAYHWMGVAALLLILICSGIFRKPFSSLDTASRRELRADLTFPPFLILLVLVVLAGTLYITTVLDSLSYRIPRMLMWLQEGRLHFIDNPDFRMNFMSPFWEFVSTPIYQATGLRFLWLGSAMSWCLLYLSFVYLAAQAGVDCTKLRWIAIIPTASVGFVLQAASTMNDIWAASLLAISLCFILSFEEKKRFWDMVASGLALALAANGKAHFAVLALPWLLWFFLSKSKPLHSVKWAWAAPIAMLVLLCSPLPTFVSNHIYYGSFKGQAGDEGFGLGGPILNLSLGSVKMLWQIFQPPINPFATKLENLSNSWIESTGLADVAPRFGLSARELSIVDSASIGLVVSILLCLGLVRVLRNRKNVPRWLWFSAAAGIVGFLIAVSQVVPGTLGRSFLGLTVPIIPLCLWGLNRYSRKWIGGAAIFSLLAAAAGIVVSPSHPLWPAKTTANYLNRFHDHFVRYLNPQKKPYAGNSVIKTVPDDATEIGIMAVGDQSLIQLWNHRNPELKVRFLPSDTSTADLIKNGPRWFILIAADTTAPDALFAKLAADLKNDSRFEPFFSDEFVSLNVRGPERWILYRYLGGCETN